MEVNLQLGETVCMSDRMDLSVIEEIYPYDAHSGRALYRVKDRITGLTFALKCFNLSLNPEKDIKTELVALNKLGEPDVFPRAIRFAKSGQNGWLLLDWMHGTTLEKAFVGTAEDFYDYQCRLAALKATCSAVAKIHSRRMLHRDLKPVNVIIKNPKAPAEGAAIIDFGLAALRRQNIEGTYGYQPPEQEGARNFNLGAQADVFSLGQIGWRLITGETRVAYPNPEYTAWDEPLEDLLGIFSKASPKLAHILYKAMAFKPTERYASAGQMLAELKGIRS